MSFGDNSDDITNWNDITRTEVYSTNSSPPHCPPLLLSLC